MVKQLVAAILNDLKSGGVNINADKASGKFAGYNYKAIYDSGSIPIIKMRGDSQK
ncbi:unnamed protein product, partial [marine sediment metagenome]